MAGMISILLTVGWASYLAWVAHARPEDRQIHLVIAWALLGVAGLLELWPLLR